MYIITYIIPYNIYDIINKAGSLIFFHDQLVSSPDPDSQQLRVDYITATWKVGLGNKNDALVPSVLQCLCPKLVRQSKFRTNLAQLDRNERYHFRILLRVLSIVAKYAFGRAASEDWVCSPLLFQAGYCRTSL